MSSQIVQERETIEIPLGDYFKGSLLDYQYCIANRSQQEQCRSPQPKGAHAGKGIDFDIKDMVYKSRPFGILDQS
jgi:hypothetical protein